MIRGARLFEVGDTVRIHPKAKEIKFINMNDDMRSKAGFEVIIEQVNGNRTGYYIDEDGWMWEDLMFEYSEDDVFRAFVKEKINERQYEKYMLMLKDIERRRGY